MGRTTEGACPAHSMAAERKQRIAFLDDSPTVRMMLATLLETAGYEPCACAEWSELRALLERAEPDLVLLDVEMPDIVGEHIGFGLKRTHPALRVVYLSDRDPESLAELCRHTGVDGYLRKSSDLEQLVKEIAEFLPRPTD